MFERRETREIGDKQPRYWHRVYGETVPKEELPSWAEVNNILYIGEFSDEEWENFLRNCQRDADGELIIAGKEINSEGNPIEK